MWKTTDRYVQQKRVKAVEAESRLKQVYIPNYVKPNPAAVAPGKVTGELIPSTKPCESCSCKKNFFFCCSFIIMINWYFQALLVSSGTPGVQLSINIGCVKTVGLTGRSMVDSSSLTNMVSIYFSPFLCLQTQLPSFILTTNLRQLW